MEQLQLKSELPGSNPEGDTILNRRQVLDTCFEHSTCMTAIAVVKGVQGMHVVTVTDINGVRGMHMVTIVDIKGVQGMHMGTEPTGLIVIRSPFISSLPALGRLGYLPVVCTCSGHSRVLQNTASCGLYMMAGWWIPIGQLRVVIADSRLNMIHCHGNGVQHEQFNSPVQHVYLSCVPLDVALTEGNPL